MWLQPALRVIATAAARIYYRLEISGPAVPAAGPALLVANHPNGLHDPALVVTAACRKVRYLAKSTLFTDPRIGWLIRGVGAIPVYRRMDDPTQTGRNRDTFEAAFEALGRGDAVGIFPEGTSHSMPSLSVLKTGAARMALGTFEREGRHFPIVPIGLMFRRKAVFRSEALALLGEPVEWSDLAPRGADDREAVRELTRRIGLGLRAVTVNLERWDDAPLVEWTEAIWAAEHEEYDDRGEQLARIRVITTILGALRHRRESLGNDPAVLAASELGREIYEHRERLQGLELKPRDLSRDAARRAGLPYRASDPISTLVGAAGYVMFWLPYWLTGRIASRSRPRPETQSTFRLLIGVVVYGVWLAGLTALASRYGAGWALATLIGGPSVGLLGLWIRERRREMRRVWKKVSRVLPRKELIPSLRREQHELANRLEDLYEAWSRGEIHASVDLDERDDSAADRAEA